MLNELASLQKSLSGRGIHAQTWHSWIQKYKKGSAIVAELGDVGNTVRVSVLAEHEVAQLRNIAPDFHNSFPGLNLNCPLVKLSNANCWNKTDLLWQEALEIGDETTFAYDLKDLRRLGRLIGDFPVVKLMPCLDGDSLNPKLLSTLAVLKRLESGRPLAIDFLRGIARNVVRAAIEGRITREVALEIIFGKANRKKQQLENWSITLILEADDFSSFPFRVADPAVPAEWSARLLAYERLGQTDANEFICGLTGKSDTQMDMKMPSPNLNVLGITYLMSMNQDIPCQTRYRKTSTAIFPIGKTAVQELNDSLLYITDPSRRNLTWGSVPNGVRDQGDLLVAYLESDPESKIPVASFFADVESEEGEEEATYETRTSRAYDALRLREIAGSDSALSIFALSNIDKGRTQVVFSARYSLSVIQNGRSRWLAGVKNVPKVTIPFPVGKGKPADWRSDFEPSPSQVAISFKMQWLRAGQSSQSVPGVDIGRMYSLLLDPNAADQASWLMDRYLGLTEPLFIGLGRFLSGGEKLSDSARKEALVAIAVYGLLLLIQGRNKETYMKSRDYQLGQFLQMSDLLHKLYCQNERKGSIPPQLIGNAAIPMALQSPRRALQVLGARIPIYLAWAERYQGIDARLVKWCRNELRNLSAELSVGSLDASVTNNGKAELLLGYLARAGRSMTEGETL